MGFDLRDSGFHIVLSKDVPEIIRERVKSLAEGFLARHGLRREDVSAFLLHPGGQKLLSYMQAELGLSRDGHGSILGHPAPVTAISPAPAFYLFCTNGWFRREMPSGSYGLVMAFGPGFTAEMMLIAMAMTFAYLALLVVVGAERLAELVISRRNQRQTRTAGRAQDR